MEQKVFNILSKAPFENDVQVSLKRFINYLAERAEKEKSFRKKVRKGGWRPIGYEKKP